ncbi:MAG: hypothetical protein F4017_01975 [Acidimicrobiaceae bacterium]|nr:hypothetical protein [Acidimicrobiaceae bacterium]MYK73351.1 hypothetical protein [Acidimicrobiaceae bacterium]
MASRQVPGIRLLFDENLPWRVASALHELRFPVSYVGDNDASPASPDRGSSDAEVLDHAARFNQIIATSNLDMILLCVERDQSVVWIDPRGRQLRREDLALLVFKNVRDWAQRLDDAAEPVCLRAMRTRTDTLELSEAGRLARDRMSRMTRRSTRTRQPRPRGDLFTAK